MTRVNRFNLVVYAFLLAIALSIVIGATAYAGKQRLTAFVIGVPTIGLLAFLVLAELTPRFVRLTRAFGASDDDAPEAAEGDAGGSGGGGGMEAGSNKRVAVVYGWLALYFGVTFALGFYVAIPIFMTAFLIFESRLKPVYAVAVTVAAGALLYLVFETLLEIPLWAGALPRVVPGVFGGGVVPQLN